MKKLTTAALVFALLLAAAGCKGNDTPAETTGTTAPVTTEATTETTTAETTAETTVMTTVTTEVTTEVVLDQEFEDLPVYESSLDISGSDNNVFAQVQDRFATEGDAPLMYAVVFPEAPTLALICETFTPDGYGADVIHSRIVTVYFDGYRYDKEIFLLGGTSFTMEYTDDVLAIVEMGGTMPGNGVLICKNGVEEITDFCMFPKAVNGEMTYRFMTTEGCWLGISAGAVLQMEGEDIYEITGTAKATDAGIVMDEATRVTMNDLFWSEEWRQVREENGLESFEEYKEYVFEKLEKDYEEEEFNKNKKE